MSITLKKLKKNSYRVSPITLNKFSVVVESQVESPNHPNPPVIIAHTKKNKKGKL